MLAALMELGFLLSPYFLGVWLRHRIDTLEAREHGAIAPSLGTQLLVGVVTFICTHLTVMFPIASAVLTEIDPSSTATYRSAIVAVAFFVVQGFLSMDVATAGRSLVRQRVGFGS